MHAHNHITPAVVAMDSCFALIGANQHGIAVGSMSWGTCISKTCYCRGECTLLSASSTAKQFFSSVCFSAYFGLVSKVVTVWVTFFQQCLCPQNIPHLIENIKGFLMQVKSLRNIILQHIQNSSEGFHQNWNIHQKQIYRFMKFVTVFRMYASCFVYILYLRPAGFLILIIIITWSACLHLWGKFKYLKAGWCEFFLAENWWKVL